MIISIWALKETLNGKILLLRFFFCRVYISTICLVLFLVLNLKNFFMHLIVILKLNQHLVIVGDLNEGLLNDNFRNFRDILLANSLQNIISIQTRGRALLDSIIVTDGLTAYHSGVLPKSERDFRPFSYIYITSSRLLSFLSHIHNDSQSLVL